MVSKFGFGRERDCGVYRSNCKECLRWCGGEIFKGGVGFMR